MKTTLFLVCLVLSTVVACTTVVKKEKEKTKKPNFIVILSDDQGYADLGVYGAEDFSTPNLDQLASEGVKFTNFYAASTCSPCRASLLTGTYAGRISINGPINNANKGLNPDEVTIAEILKENNYSTALIGKWHLGLPDEMSPIAQGFDYFSGIPLSQLRHGPTEHFYYKKQWKKMWANGESELELDPNDTLFTQRSTQEALAYINRNKDKPFFLYLAHPMVHLEVLASKGFSGKTPRVYSDACQELDWSVGEITKELKKLKLDKNTFIMYCSDNGPWLNRGEQSGSAKPLRDGKFSAYEGGVRVPCIMKYPGNIAPGKIFNGVTSVIDILPTIAKLAGAEIPTNVKIDGVDIMPYLKDEITGSPHELYYYFDSRGLVGVRKGKWKLYYAKNNLNLELYDLENDIGESNNLSIEKPETLKQMLEIFNEAKKDILNNSRPIGELSLLQ